MVEITGTFKSFLFMRRLLPRLVVRILNECDKAGTAGCHKKVLKYRIIMMGKEALIER
jgi:hypothetical protein